MLPGIVGQESVDDTAARSDDLTGNPNEVVDELLELHLQNRLLLALMLFQPAPRILWKHQSPPCFQVPCQGRHYLIGPIAFESVQRSLEGVNAILELFDQVFLFATIVCTKDDFLCRTLPIIGDIK